jgi:hypothetical protein
LSRLQGRLRECAESCMKLELMIEERRRKKSKTSHAQSSK